MASCTAPAPAPVVAAPAGSARNVDFSPPPDESAEAEEGDPEARSAKWKCSGRIGQKTKWKGNVYFSQLAWVVRIF